MFSASSQLLSIAILPACLFLLVSGGDPSKWSSVQQLRVEPEVAYIYGARSAHSLLFTARLADGIELDVTDQVTVAFDRPDVVVSREAGKFEGQKEGIVKLQARLGNQTAESVLVVRPKRNVGIDFATDVAPIFSKMGCNNSNCHGALNGQNGFKLSLFGYDPDADYKAIVEVSEGRRINLQDPEKSLLVLKPTMSIPHGGGHILEKTETDHDYQTLLRWIGLGTPKGNASSPRLVKMEVFPKGFRVLNGLEGLQRIVVVGRFSDGTQEDITRHVRFTSSNNAVAEVTSDGLIVPVGDGEATILIRTLGQVSAVQVAVTSREKIAVVATPPANFIDEFVFDKLQRLKIGLSDLSTDYEFLRRIFLDVIGILPTADEVRAFLAETSAGKRDKLIRQVLERREYADFWAMKWGDLLANDPILVGRDGTAYLQDWLRDFFKHNKPYDQFVREILTATGSTWENGAANYFSRSEEDLATVTSQVFLGVSLECARCHDHPEESWKRDDFMRLAAFFSQVSGKGKRFPPPEGIRYLEFDQEFRHPETKERVKPRFLDGTEPVIRPLQDRRQVLADWITSPENPWFAKATVNRIWRQLMGRGLVEPVDDFRTTNPSSNEQLLESLAQDFIEHKYDLKHLIWRITSSNTYQLSSLPKPNNKDDRVNYSRYYLRELTAEQLLDSIVQVTAVPEQFLGYYPGIRAVNLADPGVPSSFLDMYGRPKREAAKCERNEEPSLSQAMHMLAGDTLNEKIGSPAGRLTQMIEAGKSDPEIVEHFYLSALCRYPEEQEVKWCAEVISRAQTRRKGLENVVWALLNSGEFMYNH